MRVDDSVDPYLLQRATVVLEQALEVDRVDEGAFAIDRSVHVHGLLDERQCRAGTKTLCGYGPAWRSVLSIRSDAARPLVAEQVDIMSCETERVIKYVRLIPLVQP